MPYNGHLSSKVRALPSDPNLWKRIYGVFCLPEAKYSEAALSNENTM